MGAMRLSDKIYHSKVCQSGSEWRTADIACEIKESATVISGYMCSMMDQGKIIKKRSELIDNVLVGVYQIRAPSRQKPLKMSAKDCKGRYPFTISEYMR